MKNEEIIKELEEILGTCSIAYVKNNVRKLIEKLQPKPLFIPGPAKLRNGWDAKIYEVFDDCIHGYYLPETGEKLLYCWGINGLLRGNSTTKSDIDLLPNNEPEKVYGPQECNEPVKLCMNCEHEEGTVCFSCHGRDKWTPAPTDKELWDRVLAVEKAHKDAADSKLNFGDKGKA